MDLKLQDVARLLEVDPDTVLGWIKERGLPAHRFLDQYKFNSVELQEWALRNHVRIAPDLDAMNRAPAHSDLAAALERGGVYSDVPGGTRDEVLAAVTRLPGIPA